MCGSLHSFPPLIILSLPLFEGYEVTTMVMAQAGEQMLRLLMESRLT